MKAFKPMLAGKIEDIHTITFPIIASPKLDGIRAVIVDGVVMSRSLKPIPNQYVQELFGNARLNGLDGELIVGDPCDKEVFRTTTSGVMSKEGRPEVKFYVFDDYSSPEKDFPTRLGTAKSKINSNCVIVEQNIISNLSDLECLEETYLQVGYEGVMVRKIKAPYKFGRSTQTEGYLLKLKRFCDSEAKIIGFEEQMANLNAATTNKLGNTVRSLKKAGLKGKRTLGAILVIDLKNNVEFAIGSGLDDETRTQIWNEQEKYIGNIVKYKFFPTGSKEKPRFPTFLGFRHSADM